MVRGQPVVPRLLSSFACGALMVSAGCSSGGSGAPAPSAPGTHIASSAQIWFHPKPNQPGSSALNDPNAVGSTDFLQLFEPNAPWARVEAHTRVLGLYAGWVTTASDQMLQETVAFVNAHGMGIELEAPSLQATASCGSGVEGYVPFGQTVHDFTLSYLQRLKALGAPSPFIKVDEPLFFGNVTTEPGACQWPVSHVATEVAAYVQLVKTVYPSAEVGDVEPIIASAYVPDVVTAIGQWDDAFRSASGAPFPFYIADIDFSNGAWPALVKSMETATRGRGMKFGIIYIGDMQDTSDAEWSAKVVSRFQLYQGESGGKPDYVLFQSWDPYPQYCLPESDPTSFTGAIDAYISATAGT